MTGQRAAVVIVLSFILATCLHSGARAQNGRTIPAKKYGVKREPIKKTEEPDNTTAEEPELSRKERKEKRREERRKEEEARERAEAEQQRKAEKAKREAKKSAENKLPKPAAIPTAKRKQEVQYPPTRLKKSYRINVLLPLYLDELVKGDNVTFKDHVPEKATQGLQFYQGLKLAADSLKRTGYNFDIYIHDIGSFSETPEMLINDRKLDSTDLIIGAVQQHDIPALAIFARKKKVNFVSALSANDGYVKGNQFFTMLQPTLKSHCEYITDDMSKKYPGQKVALLYRNTAPNEESAGQYMLTDSYSEVQLKKLLCNTLPDKQQLLTVIDTTRPNVVVIPILDNMYADSLLKALSRFFPNTHMEIYGMPTWSTMTNLRKANAYTNLTVNVTYPFSFEGGADRAAQAADRNFKKEYGGKATEMVYRGYETMMWYAALLTRYGTIFNADYKDISGAPFTKFEVKPRWDGNGSLLYNENRHIYLSTYQGGIYKTE